MGRSESRRVARSGRWCRWMAAVSLAALPVTALGQDEPSEGPSYSSPERFLGRAFIFEADLERGVELGWLDADAPRDEVLETMRQSLESRVRRSGKFVEAVVTREEGDRFAVTFVGKQSPGFEELLIAGMSAAGRLSLHAVAGDGDVAACGSTLAEERERLRSWGSSRAGEPLSRFNRLDRADGGPCEAIAWMPRWGAASGGTGRVDEASSKDVDDEPLAVLRQPSHLFRAVNIQLLKVVPLPDRGQPVADLTLHEPGLDELRAFRREAGGRPVVFAVDGSVVGSQELAGEVENPIRLDGGFAIDELRPLILAFAGEPLEAPLRFVAREQRELPNVKRRDSPTAID